MNDGAGVLILLLAAALTFACYKLARTFGADFGVTVKAVLLTLLVVVGALAAMFKRWLSVCLGTLGALVLVWPAWWPVIESSYAGGALPSSIESRLPWHEVPAWVGYAEYGLEALLIGLAIWCWRQSFR